MGNACMKLILIWFPDSCPIQFHGWHVVEPFLGRQELQSRSRAPSDSVLHGRQAQGCAIDGQLVENPSCRRDERVHPTPADQ